MKLCPFCNSDYIFYSRKIKKYCCENCNHTFSEPIFEKKVKLFISYGHDSNTPLVEKIRNYLVDKGYDVWIDNQEINYGDNWRKAILDGLITSNGVLAFLSKHSVRKPDGVCLDELKIALCVKHLNINTILLEKESEVNPPSNLSEKQWLDMSDWKNVINTDDWDNYFDNNMNQLIQVLQDEKNIQFQGQIEFLHKFLNIIDNDTKEQRLIKNIFIGRKWLLNQIDDWISNSSERLLIIEGVPGAGKSAITTNLLHYFPQVLLGIFFEWDSNYLKDPRNFIQLLAFKLAARLSDYRQLLVNLCEQIQEKDNYFSKLSISELFSLLIINPLQNIVGGNRSTQTIILDGLDEATPEIMELISEKINEFPNWIKFIITSRPSQDFQELFNAQEILLNHYSQQNKEDIKDYLSLRLGLDKDSSILNKIAEKCEGSFLFAVLFSDAIENNEFPISQIDNLPQGINAFYREYFKRTFPKIEEFKLNRPFFELLLTGENLPVEFIRDCLKLDRYDFWELKHKLKTLITSEAINSHDQVFSFLKDEERLTLVFIHKSISDWLSDSKRSGRYFVDNKAGFNQLVDYSLNILETESKINKFANFCSRNLAKWSAKAGRWEVLSSILEQSIDMEEISENYENNEYQHYYKYINDWSYVDYFPDNYSIDSLKKKLKEFIDFPFKKIAQLEFSHRSLISVFWILGECQKSGRFLDLLDDTLSRIYLDGYFRSGASDMVETRDGWDKFHILNFAQYAYNNANKNGFALTRKAFLTLQRLKLSAGYYFGKPESYMPTIEYLHQMNREGVLNTTGDFFKDICKLRDEDFKEGPKFKDGKELRDLYNTLSLASYLCKSEEEDYDFIKECLEYQANLDEACKLALEVIEGKKDITSDRRPVRTEKRKKFVKDLLQKNFSK